MTAMQSSSSRVQQHGAGMIETLVGILIGLLVVLVVYNMLAVAEGYRRMTSGSADAQITGLMSQFVAGQDAANGGNGITSAYSDLINCNVTEVDVPYTADNTLKPISVLITKGVLATDSDSFVSRQGSSPHVVWPVAVRPLGGVATVAPGGNIQVQSPNGFLDPAKASLPTAAVPWWAVAIANDGTGRCTLIQIADAAPDALIDANGEVTLTQGAPATAIPYKGVPQNDTGTGAFILSFGRVVGGASRIRYDVVNNQLRTTDCLSMAAVCAGTPNPIAQNVVWMKVQYGIDTSDVKADGTLDGTVDCWTPADNSVCPVVKVAPQQPANVDWLPDTLIKAGDPAFPLIPANTLNRIVAVRIGLVVRSDEPDPRDPAVYTAPATTIDGVTVGTRPATYLFNCATNTNAACQSRVLIPAGAAAPNVLLDGWRYRTYEVVVPLRNSIFSATLAP
jgi:type IV pilus assembly protein PilW